jgi:aryl-alcohol dehydrogenase-like predicted oxidoreductase
LTGKYDSAHTFEQGDRRNRDAYVNFSDEGRRRNLKIVDTMREIQRHHSGRNLAQIALRWILDRVPGSVALVGVKTIEQIRSNAGALGWKLSALDMEMLNAVSAGGGTTAQSAREGDERVNLQAHH